MVRLLSGKRIVALTGAGLSTESGIPDYRGPGTRERARNPIQHRDFLRSHETRARYWARAMVGWLRFRGAEPNAGHRALAQLEDHGALSGVITQNVDGLHARAGSRRVIELHGALARVRCLECACIEARDEVQARLMRANPDFVARRLGGEAQMAPDGDAELDASDFVGFEVVACRSCGGVLKPDVVFFGDNVARPIVDDAFGLVDDSEALLVLGTSLAVFSGYRFVRRAAERGLPIAMVNLGQTRGDEHCAVRIEAPLGDVLPQLVERLGASPVERIRA